MMNYAVVKLQKNLLSFYLLFGSLFLCVSCSSDDNENANENKEIWTFEDKVIIDKYKKDRMLMGSICGWRENEYGYDGQHSLKLYADRTCRYTWTVGTMDFFTNGTWKYNQETNRLITTTNFPKLILKIFSLRDMCGYTDDGKLINVTIPSLDEDNSKYNKFRNDDTTFDFLVGKWENKSTGAMLTIHANGEYQIKNHNVVYSGNIDKWIEDGLGAIMKGETLLLKESKIMEIGLFSGSLMEIVYITNIRIGDKELLYDIIKECSGSYEYIIDD